MQKVILQAEPRNVIGRAVKSLRRQDLVPAVIYGHDFKALSIQVPMKELERVYAEAGESTVVYLNVNGQDHPTIIHDIVRDALSDKFLHADFYKVRLDEKIHAKIQFNFIGESPAVKEAGGVLVKNIDHVKVEALPSDLVNEIVIDVSLLKTFDDVIRVADISVPKGIVILDQPEEVIAVVTPPRSEAELAELEQKVEEKVEDVEGVKKEEPAEEGETPAATEEQPKEKE
jgi:large subunit ribosomal protein L25